MLIQFSTKNYKCFKEEAKLSLIASNYDKSTRIAENTFEVEKFGVKLLKSAVVYGANASGKTKLIEAMAFMRHFIFHSSKESQIDEPIEVSPFLLSTETLTEPSCFELIFIHENEMYRYGFEVDQAKVHAEWLYHKPKTREIELFYRDFQQFEIHKRKFKVADLIAHDRIRPNALLLSVAASWNDPVAGKIFDWLKTFHVISGIKEEGYEGFSMARIRKDEAIKQNVLHFLKGADLGIEDISIKTVDVDHLSEEFPEALKEVIRSQLMSEKDAEFLADVITYHKRYNEQKLFEGHVEFSMDEDESSGTKKYFALSGPILETLKHGHTLVVDELANKLHPNLVIKLVELFNSAQANSRNAQVIFNTHDTQLLAANLFRRDQIWFTEKDRYGAVSLYSLSDFKGVRKKEDFEKNYIQGKYGAVPYLEELEKLFTL